MNNKPNKKKRNKKALINSVAQDKKIHPNDTRQVIPDFLDKVIETLAKGEHLEFRDFGVFELVKRKQKIWQKSKKLIFLLLFLFVMC